MEELETYSLEETEIFSEDMAKHISSGQKKIVERILNLIEEIKQHPTTGKGERLIYSRRINDKHRLVYEIFEEEKLVVLATAYGHYKNK